MAKYNKKYSTADYNSWACTSPQPPTMLQRLEKATELALEAEDILNQLLNTDHCNCITFTLEQLEVSRRLAQRLDAILDLMIIEIACNQFQFIYFDYILGARQRVSVVIDDLATLILGDLCQPGSDDCEQGRLYGRALTELQIALHDLFTIFKFMELE